MAGHNKSAARTDKTAGTVITTYTHRERKKERKRSGDLLRQKGRCPVYLLVYIFRESTPPLVFKDRKEKEVKAEPDFKQYTQFSPSLYDHDVTAYRGLLVYNVLGISKEEV